MAQHSVHFGSFSTCPCKQCQFCNCRVRCPTHIMPLKCINCVQIFCIFNDLLPAYSISCRRGIYKNTSQTANLSVSPSDPLNLCFPYIVEWCHWVRTDVRLSDYWSVTCITMKHPSLFPSMLLALKAHFLCYQDRYPRALVGISMTYPLSSFHF